MLNFIILGYVPGTSIQISFEMYLVFFAWFVLMPALLWYSTYYSVRKNAARIAAIQLISL